MHTYAHDIPTGADEVVDNNPSQQQRAGQRVACGVGCGWAAADGATTRVSAPMSTMIRDSYENGLDVVHYEWRTSVSLER